MDWEIVGLDNKELAQEVPKIIPVFDQMILEMYDETEALFAAVMSFWFGSRAMPKMKK